MCIQMHSPCSAIAASTASACLCGFGCRSINSSAIGRKNPETFTRRCSTITVSNCSVSASKSGADCASSSFSETRMACSRQIAFSQVDSRLQERLQNSLRTLQSRAYELVMQTSDGIALRTLPAMLAPTVHAPPATAPQGPAQPPGSGSAAATLGTACLAHEGKAVPLLQRQLQQPRSPMLQMACVGRARAIAVPPWQQPALVPIAPLMPAASQRSAQQVQSVTCVRRLLWGVNAAVTWSAGR